MTSIGGIISDPFSFDYDSRLAELSVELTESARKQTELDRSIAGVLRQNIDLPRRLNLSLSRLNNRLTLVESDVSQLSNSLALTSVLAENVSGKVRELDVSKGRVVECLQRTEDMIDLRHCTEGVEGALLNEDYEAAAEHIHRFLALDSAVFQLGDKWDKEWGSADGALGSPTGGDSHSLKGSYTILKKAEQDLRVVVESKFEEALSEGDVASMERFFKLFPLLNLHDVGLTKFTGYLRTKVAESANGNFKVMEQGGGGAAGRTNVLYADTLTLLFEGVARVIDVHQPLVDAYYGRQHMLLMVQLLQEECDVQAERILNEFVRRRQYDSKARLIDTYSRQAVKYAHLEKLDPIELDVLLGEVCLLHTRAELYLRFLKRRVDVDASAVTSTKDERTLKAQEDRRQRFAELVKTSKLSRKMQELIGQYISMEQYYMRESIEKAVNAVVPLSDEVGENVASQMVDDVFFIVRKCVRRSLSSSNIDCVCAVLNNACSLLETDYCGMLKTKLKAGYPPAGSFAEAYTTAAAYSNVVLQGDSAMLLKASAGGGGGSAGQVSGAEGAAEKARRDFLQALNDSQASAECAAALKRTLAADFQQLLAKQCSAQEMAKLDHSAGQLDDVGARLADAARSGVDRLTATALKTRLKASADAFPHAYNHTPTDVDFQDFQANDPFIEYFIATLDALVCPFESALTKTNYQYLLNAVGMEVARQIEKAITKTTFNRLGGLQLDKEIRQLTAYLTSVAGWSVREKLVRLTQIAALLNVESATEARELQQCQQQQTAVAAAWRLTPTDVRQLLALRIDLVDTTAER